MSRKHLIQDLSRFAKQQLLYRLKRPQTFEVTLYGQHRFRCSNPIEVTRTVHFGGEPAPLGAFLFLLQDDDVVWDIGASVGLFTVHSAARVRRVVAFEPDPATHRRLVENVQLNGLSDQVETHQLALGDRPGQLTLYTDGLSGMAPSVANLGRHQQNVVVPVHTLDDLVAKGLPAPSVIKIDIEGAEMLCLSGASQSLNSPQRPRLIFLEVHPQFLPSFGSTPDQLVELLQKSGYQEVSNQAREDQFHSVWVRVS